MKGRKGIIIMPESKRPSSIKDALSYAVSVNKTISFVDDLTTIKNAQDRVFLKNLKVKEYRAKSNEDFIEDIHSQLSDGDGASFLICKN